MTRWEDVDVRARGLRNHLLTPERLASLAGAPDLAALGSELVGLGFQPAPVGAPSAPDLELLARREVARRFRTLARWLGPRTATVSVLFEDEDRRSIRALLRGAAAGIPAESRLTGLMPTPALPERALEELSHRAHPHEVAALLALWSHPLGHALLAATDPEHPDLTRMELALQRGFAERARRGAGRGGRALRAYVTEAIDLLNTEAALLLAAGGHELKVDDVFLEGGALLDAPTFRAAASAEGPAAAAARLAPAFAGSGFEEAIRHAGQHPGSFERETLPVRLRRWHRRIRQDPLGGAALLEYGLRLRAQLLQLRDLIWATATGVPPARRLQRLLGE
jgi:vacuolar-type H+-ATPase subunit C/Vma6